MVFVLTDTFPTKSSTDIGNLAMKVLSRRLPRYVKRIGPYVTLGGDGVKSYTFFDVEKGCEDEVFKEVSKSLVPFFGIEGYKATIEVALPTQEALPLVGLPI